jgi:hypothetical protein
MNKYYYILDDYNRFFYITDIKREDMPELQEIETDLKLSEIHTNYHGILNGKIEIIGETEQEILVKSKSQKIYEIKELKDKLLNTDYQVIKCYESQLANEEMPYNLQELLGQRKAWRDEINTLEFEISMLG